MKPDRQPQGEGPPGHGKPAAPGAAGRRMAGRSHFWREQSHRESHDGAAPEEQLGPLAAHPLASPDPPTMVAAAGPLAEMLDHLGAAGSFAFDSEFIGERSYEPRLCLVQAATARRVFVIDPLADLDLSGLWELLVSPAVEKIVLAGQQDFGPAVQRTGRPPANIMDVQIAAGFVHVEYPLSLSRLVAEFTGAALGKGLTFTHWDNRPLSPRQVRYAADDVRYLPAAREAIGRRLAELGRSAWAREECAATLAELSLYQPSADTIYLRVRGRDRMGRRQLAVLRELAIVRDQAARREDVPARTLLKDGILAALARHPVRELKDLHGIKGLPRPVERAYGRQIVEATARGLALPDDQLPAAGPRDEPAFLGRVDRLWAAINDLCLARSVAPALVTSRRDVARACQAAAGRHGSPGLAGRPAGDVDHRLFRGWRRELLGGLLDGLG